MSRYALQIYAAVVFGLTSAGANAGDPIHWAPDLESARSGAVAQNKLLLLHFWTPDCGPCKVVDQKVFPTPTVSRFINQNYIPLKVNAYRNPDLRNHFNVVQWPTDIIATADGQIVYRMVTPQNPNRYVNELMTAVIKNRRRTETEARRRVASGPVEQLPAQMTSQPTNTPTPWADGIEDPELTENTARAIRPGVNPQMSPGVNPEFPSGVTDFGADRFAFRENHRPSRFDNPGANSPATNVAAFGATNNRFGVGNTVHSSVASSKIENPYVQSQSSYDNGAEYNTTNTFENSKHVPNELTAGQRIARQQTATDIATRDMPLHNSPLQNTPAVEVSLPGLPPIGFDGRCPVTLTSKGTWKKGDTRWGAVHRGNLYLFAGAQEQQEFLTDPDRFSPVLAGMDVVRLAEVGKVVQGDRRFGVLFDDDGNGPNSSRIFLFDSVESRNRFEATPDLFLRPVMQAAQQGDLDTLLR